MDADAAATVIQAHWRGHAARRALIEELTAQLEHEQQLQQQLQEAPSPAATGGAAHGRAGLPDVWDRAANAVVRNRGILASAAAARRQQLTLQQRAVLEWQQFAARSALRWVPPPPNPARRRLPESVPFRLRVLRVSGIPQLQHAGGAGFELQLGVTLFDETLGAFYGTTCCSPTEALPRPLDVEAAGGSSAVEFSFDVFFHSAISDPRCMAVVELILVEREADGACRTRCSAGWAQLPLCLRKAKPQQLVGHQGPATAPVMSGTPRYLQFRSVCGEQLPPPAILGSCMVAYQAEVHPAMAPVRALLPQDFLVSHADVVPGLRRFDLAGGLSTGLKATLSTLASPVLAAACAVDLAGVELVVPQLLHNLLGALPQLAGALLPPPGLASLLALPCEPGAASYALRLRLHNGRTFVGPWVSTQLQVVPHMGSLLLRPRAQGPQELRMDWLLADRLIALVLELLATPAAEHGTEEGACSGSGSGGDTVLVGRAVFAPFEQVAQDGAAATLAEGRHRLAFDSSSSLSSTFASSCWAPRPGGDTAHLYAGSSSIEAGPLLPLNWRALLADSATRRVPDPCVQFELRPADRAPELPPLSAAAVAAAGAPTPAPLHSSKLASAASAAVHQAEAAGAAVGASHAAAGTAMSVAAVAAPAADDIGPARAHQGHGEQQQQWQAGSASLVAHASPAAQSLRVAARHLEEAASIPVQTPCGSAHGGPPAPQAGTAGPGGAGNGGAGAGAGAGSLLDAAAQQQLRQLADTMQRQLDMLAAAVAELRQERHTLRSSLTLLESAATTTAAAAACAHTPVQPQPEAHCSSSSSGAGASSPGWPPAGPQQPCTISAGELEWIRGLAPDSQGAGAGQLAEFSGRAAAAPDAQHTQPSRAVLQQLHEAGMTNALPPEVQALLQVQAATSAAATAALGRMMRPQAGASAHAQHPSGSTALLLSAEARDPRTACDVVLQLLAFRPAQQQQQQQQQPCVGGSPVPRSMYFTLSLYGQGPSLTQPCLLTESPGGQEAASSAGGGPSPGPGPGPGPGQAGHTYILLPAQQVQQQWGGAGLVLKYSVDGSSPGQLLPGQDPAQAAFDAHMAFCRYLATRRLCIDVWDGDSLLQVGTCATQLCGLLRQGRELAEVLVEVPVLQHRPAGLACSSSTPASLDSQVPGTAQQHALGWLVLRLINIGREPSNLAARMPDFDAAQAAAGPDTPGKRHVCVRAALFQPGSPVAKELRAGSSSPFAADWQQRGQHSGAGDGRSTARGRGKVASDTDDAAAAASAEVIISFEQRKVAREQRLKQLLQSPGGSPTHSAPGTSPHATLAAAWAAHSSLGRGAQQLAAGPGSPLAAAAARVAAGRVAGGGSEAGGGDQDPLSALQRQLLSDVDAVRKRQKPGFLRAQLRKGLVTRCVIQPRAGEALLLEHALANPLGRDAVFELRISSPQQLCAVQSLQELRGLKLAAGPARPTTSPASAAAEAAAAAEAGGSPPPRLAQLAGAVAGAVGGSAGLAAAACELASRGRIFAAAGERVRIPLCFRLQQDEAAGPSAAPAGCSSPGVRHQHHHHQQVVNVEFVPLGLDWPVAMLELEVHAQPALVDRTLRYNCPERELLHAELHLAQLAGAPAELLAAAAAGRLAVAASRSDVGVAAAAGAAPAEAEQQAQHAPAGCGGDGSGDGSGGAQNGVPSTGVQQQQQQQQQQQRVCLRYKCGASPEAVEFLVFLYGDAAMARPLEVWQVFIHALQRVDMRAAAGQQSSASLAVAGGARDRLVSCYTSNPGELAVAPGVLSLPAGGVSALSLTLKPLMPGRQWVLVHLVDATTRQLVHALIVVAEAHLPPMHRRMEVCVKAGSVSQHDLALANATSRHACFNVTTNTPWLLSIQPGGLQELAPAARRLLALVVDARALAAGSSERGLLFIKDARGSLHHDECIMVTVHAVA